MGGQSIPINPRTLMRKIVRSSVVVFALAVTVVGLPGDVSAQDVWTADNCLNTVVNGQWVKKMCRWDSGGITYYHYYGENRRYIYVSENSTGKTYLLPLDLYQSSPGSHTPGRAPPVQLGPLPVAVADQPARPAREGECPIPTDVPNDVLSQLLADNSFRRYFESSN